MSRQKKKKIDTDPKAIQQIEVVYQLKNVDSENVNDTQFMFVLKFLEKIKEIRLKLSQGKVTILEKVTNYEEASIQLNKLKFAPIIRLEQY